MKSILGCLLLLAGLAQASDEVFSRGDFEVRVQPFPSTFLTPQLARQYNLPRSQTQAVLNLSVYDTRLERAVKTIPASVQGSHSNLLGQSFELEFQTIDEGEAIYYIAPFRISDDELMRFDITVLPQDSTREIDVQFQQKFYAQ
ncbi:MAG: DUF4426 domain-containing protein [Litorivicinus sp.]